MTLYEKVQQVNQLLLDGEPDNISRDQKGYSGYKPQFIIDAMNEVFGIGGWGCDEISMDSSETKGNSIKFIAKVEVWITDGSENRSTFRAYGEGLQPASAEGDAMKAAQTDAMKKALSLFSIGSRAYRGELGDVRPRQQSRPQPNPQPKPKPEQPQQRQNLKPDEVLDWYNGVLKNSTRVEVGLAVAKVFGNAQANITWLDRMIARFKENDEDSLNTYLEQEGKPETIKDVVNLIIAMEDEKVLPIHCRPFTQAELDKVEAALDEMRSHNE